MFGFLRKKLSEVVDSVSKKLKKKNEEAEGKPIVQETAPQMEPVVKEETKLPTMQDLAKEDSEPTQESAKETQTFEEPAEEIAEEKTQIEKPAEKFLEEKPPAKEEPEKKVIEEKFESVVEEIPEKVFQPVEELGAEEIKPVELPKIPEKKSFFERITEKVIKKVTEKKLSAEDIDPILTNLEEALIEADVAVDVAEKIKNDLRGNLVDREIKRGKEKEVVLESFKGSLLDILNVPKLDLESLARNKKPVLIVFWGFNGAGKTTSLAKTASWLKSKGYTSVLAAADTFRAGAEEQLDIHAENIGLKLIKHQYGADPAAVIFDAVEHAKAKGIDFILADTAGRAHTNANLMDQMEKIVRVNNPDVKILVIDSLTGNDALIQAKMYGEVGVDAVIFTKVDVNEKGGAILSVTNELKKPILFLGLGQDYSHFEEFSAEKFVNNLLS